MNGYAYIGTKDVNFDSSINYDNGIKIPFESQKFKIAHRNSTLLCIEGGSAGRKIGYLDKDVCFGNKLATITSFIVNSKYIFYVLQSTLLFNFFKINITGIIGGVSINKLKTFIIPLPPLKEQQRIIEKYENILPYISRYDDIYERLEKSNSSYKEELRKSILQYAIQGKLVKQDPNDEPADVLINKILEEKRELIKSKQIKKENLSVIYKNNTDNQFYEKFDDGTIKNITDEIPFEIPDNWAWTRLNNIGTIIGGGTPKTNIKDNWENANIPWLTPADMKNIKGIYAERGQRNISEIGLKNSSAKLMPAGTILYSSRAPIGYIAIAKNPVSTNQGFKSVVLVRNEINLFLYYELIQKTPEIISRASGTTFKEISGTDFGKTIVTIPPMEEQERIVNKLNRVLNYIEAAE